MPWTVYEQLWRLAYGITLFNSVQTLVLLVEHILSNMGTRRGIAANRCSVNSHISEEMVDRPLIYNWALSWILRIQKIGKTITDYQQSMHPWRRTEKANEPDQVMGWKQRGAGWNYSARAPPSRRKRFIGKPEGTRWESEPREKGFIEDSHRAAQTDQPSVEKERTKIRWSPVKMGWWVLDPRVSKHTSFVWDAVVVVVDSVASLVQDMLVNSWHWEKPGARIVLLNVAVVSDGKGLSSLRFPRWANDPALETFHNITLPTVDGWKFFRNVVYRHGIHRSWHL